jgi:AcrR family transcriptional regulator
MRTSSEETRRVIEQAAVASFCERGYGVATLEGIGDRVGLTRSGVLHHFKSKADLLVAVTEPYRMALALLLTTQVAGPASDRRRRQSLSRFAELLLEHRGAVRLLANDVSARVELGLTDEWPVKHCGLLILLAAGRETELTPVRLSAAIGAMIHPIASLSLDLDDARTPGELVEAAVAVIQGPAAPALNSAAAGVKAGSASPAPAITSKALRP